MKRRIKLHFKIPEYCTPRNRWRHRIHEAAAEAQQNSKVDIRSQDRLEIKVILYLRDRTLLQHDVDNRLKDILDALQGRAGGPKKIRALEALIPNDRQVFRAVIEKRELKKMSPGQGQVTISKLESKNRAPR